MAVQTPEIRKSRYNKNFGFGFYCTVMEAQAIRWAVRFTGEGKISRAAFWELAKFKRPTHQICFNTERALATLKFTREYAVTDDGR